MPHLTKFIRKAYATGDKQAMACIYCNRPVNPRKLNRHIAKKHPGERGAK